MIKSANIKFSTHDSCLILPVDRQQGFALAERLKGKKLLVEIKEDKGLRSLTANSYMWQLLTKLSREKSKEKPIGKEELYKHYITDSNAYKVIAVANKDKDGIIELWQSRGIGWVVVEAYPSRNLIDCTTLHCYYGSSIYDTKEMSELIDKVVQDCKALGIETLPPHELERLKDEWGNNERA